MEKLVLVMMADRIEERTGGVVFASVATIARDCGVSDDVVSSVVQWAEAVGVLVRHDGGSRLSRIYTLDMERLRGLPPDVPRRTFGVRAYPLPAGTSRSERAPAAPSGYPLPAVTPRSQRATTVSSPLPTGTSRSQRGKDKKKISERDKEMPIERALVGATGSSPNTVDPLESSPVDPIGVTPQRAAQDGQGRADVARVDHPPVPPVESANGAPKRASKKSEHTAEQRAAHHETMAHWHDVFLRTKGVKPIVDGRTAKEIETLLVAMQWDATRAKAVITNALADVFFRERKPTLAYLLANLNGYLAPVVGSKMSTMQSESIQW